MSIIHNRQIKTTLEKTFKDLIDLSDCNRRSETEKENSFFSRGLAALAIKILADASTEEAVKFITDSFKDNGIDAIFYNKNEKILYVVQAKWKQDGSGSIELGDTLKYLEGSPIQI